MGRYDAGLFMHADAMVDRRLGNVAKNRQTHVLKKQWVGHMQWGIETGDSIESVMAEPSLLPIDLRNAGPSRYPGAGTPESHSRRWGPSKGP